MSQTKQLLYIEIHKTMSFDETNLWYWWWIILFLFIIQIVHWSTTTFYNEKYHDSLI